MKTQNKPHTPLDADETKYMHNFFSIRISQCQMPSDYVLPQSVGRLT